MSGYVSVSLHLSLSPFPGANKIPITQFKTRQLFFHCVYLYFLIAHNAKLSTTPSPPTPHISGKVCLLLPLEADLLDQCHPPPLPCQPGDQPPGPSSRRSGRLPGPGQRPRSDTSNAGPAPGPPSCQLVAVPQTF